MDETSLTVRGAWKDLDRAVDTYGKTIDCVLTEKCEKEAALTFLKQAIRRPGFPETITIDGREAKAAAIKTSNEDHGTDITMRQVTYLNNIVGQDHRGVKRVTRPRLGCKSFDAAQSTLIGIARMHMIKKRQMDGDEVEGCSAAQQCYDLAASSPH